MLHISQIAVGGFDHNFSYLIANQEVGQCFLVDPSGDLEKLHHAVEQSGCDLIGILITHTDFDHIDMLGEVLRSYLVPIYVHEAGEEAIVSPGPIKTIGEGDEILLGEDPIRVIYTPGHTDDSVCFYITAEHAVKQTPELITGDTLFVHGCGRTTEQRVKDLYESLAEIKALPKETTIYPGHDYGPTPTSTIEAELAHNRFYQAKTFNQFHQERLG